MIPTLSPDIEHPTQQQVFDAVVEHAGRMPGRCISPPGGCYYRWGDNACFIGGIVTDEEAKRLDKNDANVSSICELLDFGGLVPERLTHPELRGLMIRLQGIHDAPFEPSTWPNFLRLAARQFNLDASIVDRVFAAT